MTWISSRGYWKKSRKPKLSSTPCAPANSGSVKIISMHVLVPGNWTVKRGHKVTSEIETEISRALADSVVFTHLEALSDPIAADDVLFGKQV